jgi:heptosyltransferase-1
MSYNDTKPGNDTTSGQPLRSIRSILVVRLGAMGDVIHALPAVARLRQAFPNARIAWAIEPRWAPLLEDNPSVDEVIAAPTSLWRKHLASPTTWSAVRELHRHLRESGFDAAVDFQGLLKSALLARLSGATRIFGFERQDLREPLAGLFYSDRVHSAATHVVEKNLALAAALGAAAGPVEFPLPPGALDSDLPRGEFVLASPVAGWKAKQWPPEHYARLAGILHCHTSMTLVLDCAATDRAYCEQIRRLAPDGACHLHVSSLAGLIAATRRARAVVGIDSGPLHLAAALGVRGVAIFGQTDPARNGPYGDTFVILRASGALTSYKREGAFAPSMTAIEPEQVWQALEPRLAARMPSAAAKSR